MDTAGTYRVVRIEIFTLVRNNKKTVKKVNEIVCLFVMKLII